MGTYRLFRCIDCGHEVASDSVPLPFSWSDGHRCYYKVEDKDEKKTKSLRIALRILENADAGDIVETGKAIKVLRDAEKKSAGDSAGDDDRAA